MSVDLRSTTMFSKVSVLLMSDHLIQLEHGRTEDRMRKVLFDSVQHVVIWRAIPWVRIVVCAIFLVLPGLLLQLPDDPTPTVLGIILIAIGLALIGMYAYCRLATIRITRADCTFLDITGVFRPGKVKRFRTRLLAAIQDAQLRVAGDVPAPSPADARGSSVPSGVQETY